MNAKTFVVTVTFDVINALLTQFNIDFVSESITFLVKSTIEVNEEKLVFVAQNLVKERFGKGTAKNFRTTSMFELPSTKFYSKENKPILVTFDVKEKQEPIESQIEKHFNLASSEAPKGSDALSAGFVS